MSVKKDGTLTAVVIGLWLMVILALVVIGILLVPRGISPPGAASTTSIFQAEIRPPAQTPPAQSLPTLTPFAPLNTTGTSEPSATPTSSPAPSPTEEPPSPTPVVETPSRADILFITTDGCRVQEVSSEGGAVVPVTVNPPAGPCARPKISPDGTRLAFLNPSANSNLYVTNVDGSGLKKVSQDYVYDYAWSADGKQLVYAGNIPDQGARGLYFVNADGSGLVHSSYAGISITAAAIHIAWSPDGKWVYAPVDDPSGTNLSLPYALNSNGSDFGQLSDKGVDPTAQVSWSPDSQSVSFLIHGYDYGYAITLLNFLGIDGTPIPSLYYDDPTIQSQTLSPEGKFTAVPFWSQDGRRAVLLGVSSMVAGEYQLLIMDRATLAFQLLANVYQPADFAAWSPAGDRIAFLALPPPNSGEPILLNVIHSDGTGLQTLAQDVSDSLPVWVAR